MKYDKDGKTIIDDEGVVVEEPTEEDIAAADAAKVEDEADDSDDDAGTDDDDDSDDDDDGEGEDPSNKTVSLKKHLKLKADLKKAKKDGGLSKEDKELLTSVKQERAEKALRTAYDGEFEKLAKLYPDLADKKESLFKLVQVAGNEEKTLEEVALDTFAGFIQKPASEDGGGSGEGSLDTSNIDFDNMSQEQHDAVMADPVAKQKYFDYSDSKN